MQKLVLHQPFEIVVPESALKSSKMIVAIQNAIPNLTLSAGSRRYFNNDSGSDNLKHLGIKEQHAALEVLVANKYYALAATGALFQYLSDKFGLEFRPNSLSFEYETIEGTMSIDAASAKHMELVSCMRPREGQAVIQQHQGTLLGALGKNVKTPMGLRRLRSSILQPFTDVPTLTARQDAIEELMQDEARFHALENALSGGPDVDRLVSSLVKMRDVLLVEQTSPMLKDVLEAKSLIAKIGKIATVLETCQSSLLQTVKESLSDPLLEELQQIINIMLNDDLTLDQFGTGDMLKHSQILQAVRADGNGLLAVARQSYSEISEDINDLVEMYSREYDFAILQVFDKKSGHFILQTCAEHIEPNLLPSVFINGSKRGKKTKFTSVDLIKLNERLSESTQEILILSHEVATQLLDEIRSRMSPLYRAADTIGILDMLQSLAFYAMSMNMAMRPEFGDTMAIVEAVHPIKYQHNHTFVANDVYAFEGANFQVLTGANMSGKTTYIKMVGLLAVMAQIGSFVPAKLACMPVFDSLMTRLGQEDEPESNFSTFAVEMRDMAFILSHMSPHSLILVDELGRGTSTFDGFGICFALCEKLLKTKSFTLFVTHFSELAELLEMYPNVVNLHLSSAGDGGPGDAFKLNPGFNTSSMYGIELAAKFGFPKKVIDEATSISHRLAEEDKPVRDLVDSIRQKYGYTAIKFVNHLKQLRRQKLPEEDLIRYLVKLKKQFSEHRIEQE